MEMPLFGKKSKPNDEIRKRLEYQLYLAKHGPDGIVDLSACELKHVPSGTYAICRVLLKEVVLLHSNGLKDLKEDGEYDDLLKLQDLRILDVHGNQLVELPSNLDRLSSLQVLNLQRNKLKSLPDALCHLKALQTLNVKENELHKLPDDLGNLSSLRTLDISDNKITCLPKSLCRARCVETLVLDAEVMVFPGSDICKAGTAEIMKFLCHALGLPYLPPSQTVLPLLNKPDPSPSDPSPSSTLQLPSSNGMSLGGNVQRTRSLGAKPDCFELLSRRAMTYENLKDERRKELIRLEAEVASASVKQMELLEMMVASRKDLLDLVAKEQTDSDIQFHGMQERRELERRRFLSYLMTMEEHTKTLIAQLLDMNSKVKRTEALKEQEERTRLMEEGLFQIKLDEYERLRKKEVERAMEMNACQYFSLEQLRAMNDNRRDQLASQAKLEDTLVNENVHLLLQNRDSQVCDLLQRLIMEENFQKEALLALMEQRDARSNRLNRQIELIQSELTHLSLLELHNKEEKEIDVKNRLREQREALCAMMMQLLEERAQRSKELQRRLIEMEKERQEEQVHFWLVHYQRLLDTKPDELFAAERDLHIDIIKILNVANASDYIPAFARHRITPEALVELTEEDLQRMGMYEVGLRKNVMQAIDGYKAEKKLALSPTAPVLPLAMPAPSSSASVVLARYEMECVICMEKECGLVFLPCGHVCSCRSCGGKILECPLCRSRIDQRIDLGRGQ